jgi:SAM-dependent methyltransferase
LKAWQSKRILFKEFNADSPFPFENESFDVVVAMMVIEHVFDPFLFVQEAARCLRPGGVFIFNVPLITGFRNRLRVLFGGIPVTSQVDWFEKRVWDGAHLHYFSVPLVKRLVATAGFSVEETNGVGKLKALKDMFPTFLANEASFIARK